MQVSQAKFHRLLVKLGPDCALARKLKAPLAVQTRVPQFVLGTAIELLYGAKGLNVLNLVHRKVSKIFETGVGEL